jgi:hypothetical protein
MRAIYIYSKHDARQLNLIERVQTELQGVIEIVELDECPSLIRKLVRETPCLIQAEEHLQGVELLKEGVDGKLLLTAEMYERMDRTEKALHNVDNARLDAFVIGESNNAIDETIMDMIIEGVI